MYNHAHMYKIRVLTCGDYVIPIPNLSQSSYLVCCMLIILTNLWLYFLRSSSFFWLGLSYVAFYSLSHLVASPLAILLRLSSLTCYAMPCHVSIMHLALTTSQSLVIMALCYLSNHCSLVYIN